MDNETDVSESNKEQLTSTENSQDSEIMSKKSNESEKNERKVEENNHHNQNFSIDDLEKELSEDIKEKIKGDAIGDTLYSERFVLKTLMELKELNGGKLEKSMENKLEILWDTTIETSVVQLLLQYDVLDLFTAIIDSTEDERLVEILLGIIANMVCKKETRQQLCSNSEAMAIILNQLTTSDPLILHQLMRLLHSTILFENSGDETIWFDHFRSCENFVEKFSFILANSTSNTLLMSSFEAMNAICAKFAIIECQTDSEKDSSFPLLFVKQCLVESLFEAFKQVIPAIESNERNLTDLIPTQSQQKFMNLFLELNMILSQYESLSLEAYKDSLPEFHKCLRRVLLPLTQKMYLLPLTSTHQGVIENINDIIQALGDPFYDENFAQMVVIWDLIEEDKNREKSSSDWEDEEDSTIIDSDDISMTILEFLTRTGFNSTQEEFVKAINLLNLDLTMKLYERISDNEEPEDEIKSVIEKMQTSIKAIWKVDVSKHPV
jgi:hypothetical protein